MKVALITEVSPLHVNGVSRAISRLLEHLTAEGHQILVIGPAGGEHNGARLVACPGISLQFYPELKLCFATYTALKALVDFQPDILHFADPNLLGPQIILACELLFPNVPKVSSYHTNIAQYAGQFGYGYLTNAIWHLLRLYHSRCSYVMCPSNGTKRLLVEHGFDSSKVLIWSRGVNLSSFNALKRDSALRRHWLQQFSIIDTDDEGDEGVSFSPDISRRATILLYVGRLSWEKNLKILVSAFLKARQIDQSIVLVLVGDGPARNELETLLKGHPAVFTGYLKGDALAKAYAAADVFGFLSKTETFGQVVLEALASGLPVIGIKDAPGVSEIVTDEVACLVNEEVSSIVDSIIEMGHLSGTKRKEIKKLCMQRASQFTWDAAGRSVSETYKLAINKCN
ncbi:glycosyltransferase family 4 protein [Tortispora caseinolytica NRRL Y-17796]|uniref:Glycosyltransferase family 4 protein n=1 Tax=Tortispora caseinolytica NRRL Y-17796 TaxID=767744 RepID=A0A1E4TKC8_9ASCO|nr:glycosyltransferase family 4 protein [Tortispora caseinolytica NRRL Y-17796]